MPGMFQCEMPTKMVLQHSLQGRTRPQAQVRRPRGPRAIQFQKGERNEQRNGKQKLSVIRPSFSLDLCVCGFFVLSVGDREPRLYLRCVCDCTCTFLFIRSIAVSQPTNFSFENKAAICMAAHIVNGCTCKRLKTIGMRCTHEFSGAISDTIHYYPFGQ